MASRRPSQDAPTASSQRSGYDPTRPLSGLSCVASEMAATVEHINNPRCARKLENISRAIDTVGRAIDQKRFETILDNALPLPSNDGTPVRKRLRDAQFRQLAEICSQAGYPQWGRRPRTFAVLRMIGCPEIIETFIAERLTDISLPYNEDNLPSFVSGQVRRRFLDCQNFVLNGRAAALEKPGEAHQNVEGSADDYFLYVEDLGAGGFGEVDSVIGEMSLMKFARKRIKRHRLYSKDKAQLQVFENELQTLKSLSHQHLVRLVGSYTDSSCVGLIMTPVAEMNLATYLQETKNSESKKICLRRFFGCLATALSYLHGKHVQHKDIKPANILVKQQKVYLTDFGTSRSWGNDSSKTTRGTVSSFTPRYCAPEVVQFGSSRNESRDIWSLGCVFLEMCSVLADHTVDEMYHFLTANGTHGEYLRENKSGAEAWVEKIKSESAALQDRQPLDLALRMCTVESRKRPLAKEVVSLIFDFSTLSRYYGLCCDEQSYSNSYMDDLRSGVAPSEEESTLQRRTSEINELGQEKTLVSVRSNYRPPAVEDLTEQTTVSAFFPSEATEKQNGLQDAGETCEAVDTASAGQSRDHASVSPCTGANWLPKKSPPTSGSQKLSQRSSINSSLGVTTVTSILQNLHTSQLPCPWPACSPPSKFPDRESLVDHLRKIHGIHELFWTPLLNLTCSGPVAQPYDPWVPGQIILEPTMSERVSTEKAFILKRNPKLSMVSSDNFTENLRERMRKTKMDAADRRANSRHQQRSDKGPSGQRSGNGQLFSGSSEDKRPKSVDPHSTEHQHSRQDETSLGSDPIPEPFISFGPHYGEGWQGVPFPRSSPVPSYFLATSNRLSQSSPLLERSTSGVFRSPPIFVYGSLMFPSVIRARAANYVSAEGVYSQQLQRRLQTSSEDWASINESLRQAAQQMTPALLEGYHRFGIQKSRDAAIISTRSPRFKKKFEGVPNEFEGALDETKGFIVFGLSDEALTCLHLDYHSDEQRDTDGRSDSQQHKQAVRLQGASVNIETRVDSDIEARVDRDVFRRRTVRVAIHKPNGAPAYLDALTYVWEDGPRERFDSWRIDKFVNGKHLRRLSTKNAGNDYDWVGEERSLAAQMGMGYTMLGDKLCDRILKDDMDGAKSLLSEGYDVNASCSYYGTSLQAAAAKGDEEMVYAMMKFYNADPNIQGGKYHSPLIAAISGGYEDVVRTLLRYGALPIARAGSFINPIYHAVSLDDVDMTLLLLEKGAWLSENYQELLDLAVERGNSELHEILDKYDIRKVDKVKTLGYNERRSRAPNDNDLSDYPANQSLKISASHKLGASAMEVFRLKGQKGKWTGMKAIRVLRKAYPNGVPQFVLKMMSSQLGSIHDLLTGFRSDIVASPFSEACKESGHSDRIENPTSSYQRPRPTSSQSTTANSQRQKSTETADEHSDANDIICMTCSGRGGRNGTGRPCTDCHGSGSTTQKKEKNSQADIGPATRTHHQTCQRCKGSGRIFSDRDRCRACGGGSGRFRQRRSDEKKKKTTTTTTSEDGDGDVRVMRRKREARRTKATVRAGRGGSVEPDPPPPPYPG